MKEFKIGDTVRINGVVYKGSVGTVVHIDDKSEKYLVRIDAVNQAYFTSEELELFST